MSYEKTVWTAGDIITAEKLNNIENGVEAASGGGYNLAVVTVTNSTGDDFYVSFTNCTIVVVDDQNNIFTRSGIVAGTPQYIIPSNPMLSANYKYTFDILSDSDIYDVTVNGNTVPFATDKYAYTYNDSSYPDTINIIINPKVGG